MTDFILKYHFRKNMISFLSKIFLIVVSLQLINGHSDIYKPETEKGVPCSMPFVYKGTTYHDCITEGSDKAWCYTDKDFKKWDYCKPHPVEFQGCKLAKPDVSLEEVQEILDEHNKFRSSLPALRMRKLSWNSELAQKAQKAAESCEYVHIESALCAERETTGQNLYYKYNSVAYPPNTPWKDVIYQWTVEQKYYDMKTLKCQEGKICGHFTATAWDKTSQIGCGKAKCHGVITNSTQYSYLYYCNYYLAGNFKGETPYKETTGEKCQDCYMFDKKEKFRCDSLNLCETCDSTMSGCMGMEDVKKLEASGAICADVDTNCIYNVELCSLYKSGMSLPQQIKDFVAKCKKTCALC